MHCFSFLFYPQTSLARNKSKSQQRDCACEEVIITGNEAVDESGSSLSPKSCTNYQGAHGHATLHVAAQLVHAPRSTCRIDLHEESWATQFSIPPTVPTPLHIAVISPPPHPIGEVLEWPKPCEESIHEEPDWQLKRSHSSNPSSLSSESSCASSLNQKQLNVNIVPVLWEKGSTPRESTPPPCQQSLLCSKEEREEILEDTKRRPPPETEHSASLHQEGPLVSPSSRPPAITLLSMLHHTAQQKPEQPPADTTEEFFPEHMIPSARMLDGLLLPETGIA